jgi:hypothetical protein
MRDLQGKIRGGAGNPSGILNTSLSLKMFILKYLHPLHESEKDPPIRQTQGASVPCPPDHSCGALVHGARQAHGAGRKSLRY